MPLFEQYIRSVELNCSQVPSFNKYPFTLPVVKNLTTLPFHPKVTFLVGENGSGKSTILEAFAVAYGFNAEGGTRNFNFASRPTHSQLYQYLKLVKGVKRPPMTNRRSAGNQPRTLSKSESPLRKWLRCYKRD